MSQSNILFKFKGKVVSGFGRGGKDLGCPTANMDDDVVANLDPAITCGVYFGYGWINNGQVHDVVLSVGWNPHYQNEKRTVEVHFLHKFENDFYGSEVECLVIGHLREMRSFSSLDELKQAISDDIVAAREECAKMENMKLLHEYSPSLQHHL